MINAFIAGTAVTTIALALPATAAAQTAVTLPSTGATSTLTASVSEQAQITVPAGVSFNVTDVAAATPADKATIEIQNIVLASATKQLRLSLIANASSFTPPAAGAITWSASDVVERPERRPKRVGERDAQQRHPEQHRLRHGSDVRSGRRIMFDERLHVYTRCATDGETLRRTYACRHVEAREHRYLGLQQPAD